MGRPFFTTYWQTGTLGFLPDFMTGRATPSGGEGIPAIATGAYPSVVSIRLPGTFWATNLHFKGIFEIPGLNKFIKNL